MKYISYKGHSGGISGLADGDTIKTEIVVGDETVLWSFEGITSSSPGKQLQNGNVAYATIGDILLSEKQLTVNVTGTTNKAPMNFNIDLSLQITVFVE